MVSARNSDVGEKRKIDYTSLFVVYPIEGAREEHGLFNLTDTHRRSLATCQNA